MVVSTFISTLRFTESRGVGVCVVQQGRSSINISDAVLFCKVVFSFWSTGLQSINAKRCSFMAYRLTNSHQTAAAHLKRMTLGERLLCSSLLMQASTIYTCKLYKCIKY